jgi:hypothetical protein
MGDIIMNTATNIDTWIWNNRTDVADEGYAAPLREAIQQADHPAYGSDWSQWLNDNVEPLLEAIFEAESRKEKC